MAKSVAVIPALDVRRSHNDRVSEALSSRFVLSALAVIALLIALVAVGALAHNSHQSKYVPYVFERSCGAQIVPAGPAQPADQLDPTTVEAWKQSVVANFVLNARMITPDPVHQRKAIARVYAFLSPGDPAFQKLSEWYSGDNDAFARGERESVSGELSSVLPQSEDTYQVDWVEMVSDLDGSPKKQVRMRAIVRVYRRATTPDTTEESLRENPLGLFVKDYSWGSQL